MSSSGSGGSCDGIFSMLIGSLTAVIGVVYFAIYGFWNHSAWVYLILDLIFIIFILIPLCFVCFESFIVLNFLSFVIVALGVLAVQVGWDVNVVGGCTIASLIIVIVMKIITGKQPRNRSLKKRKKALNL